MRLQMRFVIVARSSGGHDFGPCSWSTAIAASSRSLFRPSPRSLCDCLVTSGSCDWVVRSDRSVVSWLGERTDSASEKQAGNSSFRKLVGGPYSDMLISNLLGFGTITRSCITHNFNDSSFLAFERRSYAPEYLSKAFHFWSVFFERI